MKGFDQVSLTVLAVLAVLGLTAPFLLAARHRQPALAVAALAAAGWVIVTCVSAVAML